MLSFIEHTARAGHASHSPLILYFFFSPVRMVTPSTQSPGSTNQAATQNAYHPRYKSAASVSHRPFHHCGSFSAARTVSVESGGGHPPVSSEQPK